MSNFRNIKKNNFAAFLVSVSLLLVIIPVLSAFGQRSQKVTFGICTDVHLPTMHDSEYRITHFIESMKSARPDFIIELGDFATPDPKYKAMFDIWNSFPGERYHVIGNHEMDGGTTREQAVAYRNMKNSYYAFDRNGFRFLVLDGNDKPHAEAKGYTQFIGPEQTAWLSEQLQETPFPVIIFSHQGLARYIADGEAYGIDNYAEIQTLLQQHNLDNPGRKVIACFNGHTHWDIAENIEGIWYITLTSMSYLWMGENYQHIRFSEEVDKNFRWIKYTAPIAEPLYALVEISKKGKISIKGRKSEWVGPSPWEVGYPNDLRKYIRPAISSRNLKFSLK